MERFKLFRDFFTSFLCIAIAILLIHAVEYLKLQNIKGPVSLTRLEKTKEIVKLLPEKRDGVNIPQLSAKSFFSIYKPTGENISIVLAEKNPDNILPIASVTKLMTALVAYDYYKNDDVIKIPTEALLSRGIYRIFKEGNYFIFSDLVKTMLTQSNNDIARIFSYMIGDEKFITSMNKKAKDLNMSETLYTNPTGLDPANTTILPNHSTARDLSTLAFYLISNKKEIFDNTLFNEFTLSNPKIGYNYIATTTNELLNWKENPFKIVGGKTGWTDLAKRNLLLVIEAPNKKGYIVNVILSADDNFSDMKSLLNYIYQAYGWK